MNQDMAENLRKKGWSDEQILHAKEIMGNASTSSGILFSKTFRQSLYWIALLVSIMGNMFFAVVMIPFFLVVEGTTIYLIISVLAATFGLIISTLIRDVNTVDDDLKIIPWLFIPVFGELTIMIVLNISSNMSYLINTGVTQNAVLTSLVYVMMFTLPYIVSRQICNKSCFSF